MAPTIGELLVRINAMSEDIERRFAAIDQKFKAVTETVNGRFNQVDQTLLKIDRDVTEDYVTQAEFWPVKMIVFGGVSSVLLSFIGLVIYVVGWGK